MLMQTRLGRMVKALDKITDQKLFEYAIDKAVLDEVTRLNRSQLEQGLRADGQPIKHYSVQFGEYSNQYSDFTKEIKRGKGQRTEYIILKDSGEFYDSITAILLVDEILIDANTQKDDTNLIDEYGEEILGVSKENLVFIRNMVAPNYRRFLLEAMGVA